MHESFDRPDESDLRRDKEEVDSRFHDDDEVVPADDAPRQKRSPTRSKPVRRPPYRRHYDED
jgi:hypothetical protein